MKKEFRISIALFIVYSLLVIYAYRFNFEYRIEKMFIWIFPALCVILLEFALNRPILTAAPLFVYKWIKQPCKDIYEIVSYIIKRTCKSFGFMFFSILIYSPILALGIYLSYITNMQWIWSILGTIFGICVYITFKRLENKYNPDD